MFRRYGIRLCVTPQQLLQRPSARYQPRPRHNRVSDLQVVDSTQDAGAHGRRRQRRALNEEVGTLTAPSFYSTSPSSSSVVIDTTPTVETRVGSRTRTTRDGIQLSGDAATSPLDRLVVNSRTRQIHLNPHQESVVWKLRQEQYHRCLHRIVVVLQSHLTVEERCHRILLLHDRVVIPKRLRLRADTYEEIFHLFYANANHATDAASNATTGSTSKTSAPSTPGTSSTAAFLDAVWTMYRYMIDSGTNPTPAIVQHVMGVLDRVTTRNANVEAKAHSLMMDCDRFGFPPTNFTLESYCAICEANRAMHLALARVTDTMTRHEQQGTGGVFQRLVHGLVVNGQTDFALRVIQQLNNVSLTDGLLDTVLFAMRHSSQPEAAIAMYRSVVGSRSGAPRGGSGSGSGGGVTPTSLTISILVGVLCDDGVDVEVVKRNLPFVVGEMLRHRVPTSNDTLNRVLHGYHRIGDRASFVKFLRSMRQRNKRVFEEQFPADWLKHPGSGISAQRTLSS